MQSIPLQHAAARAAVSAFILAAISPVLLQGQQSAPRPDTAALRHRLTEIQASGPVPGFAVAIIAGDSLRWTAGFGVANLTSKRPVDEHTLFRANSVSKSLVAIAALRLVARGGLSLDAPLRAVLPGLEFDDRFSPADPVTLDDVLSHTSGFDELHLRDYAFLSSDGGLEEALAVNAAPRVPRWTPGSMMAYNNGGYAVAALAVERAAGQSFPEYLQTDVLLPTGMHRSGFGLSGVDTADMSTHYLGVDEVEPARPYPVLIQPAGGLITSVDDMASLVASMLEPEGALLPAAAWQNMRTPRSMAGLPVGYGLGSYTTIADGHLWHGHAGGTPSAFARYAIRPDDRIGFAILMNHNHGATRDAVESAVLEALAGVSERAVLPASPPPSSTEGARALRAYSGVFRQSTSNWSLTALVERLFDVQQVEMDANGHLSIGSLFGGTRTPIYTAGSAHVFRTDASPVPDVAFLADVEDRIDGLRTWDGESIRAGNYARTNGALAWTLPALFLSALLLVLVAALATPVATVIRVLHRKTRPDRRIVPSLPEISALCFAAWVVSLLVGVSGPDGLQALGRPTLPAVSAWIFGWGFALTAMISLVLSFRAMRRAKSGDGRLRRGWHLAVASASMVVVAFLGWGGLLGLRSWAY